MLQQPAESLSALDLGEVAEWWRAIVIVEAPRLVRLSGRGKSTLPTP